MQRIGIYEWPLCSDMQHYRGLYRGNSLCTADCLPPALLADLFRVSDDGSTAAFSSPNLELFRQILGSCTLAADLLVFSDEPGFVPEPAIFCLIGYDICADSAYYSPLGSGLRAEILYQGLLHHRIAAQEAEQLTVNDYGLFAAFDRAQRFSALCNALQAADEYAVESETGWRPYAIWLYQAATA